jgi:hypothetical protein
MPIRVDMTSLATLITDIREVAETVRTYGNCGNASIAANIPATLYVVAAQMESHMRGLAQADHTAARRFLSDGPYTIPQPLTFEGLRSVPTFVTPSPISRDVQIAELNAAAERLRTITQELVVAMVTRSTPTYIGNLESTATAIATFATAVG